MRIRTLAPLVLLITLVTWPYGSATGSCAGPELGAPATVRAGTELTVTGRFFVVGCDDTGTSDVLGCTADEPDAEEPMTDVALEIRQRGRSWPLGTADAGTAEEGRKGHVTWRTTPPERLRPGRAVLVAEGARLPVRVVR